MNKGAEGEISPKAMIIQKLAYLAKHLDYSEKNYNKIKRIFFSK